jgi:hypothetical protein
MGHMAGADQPDGLHRAADNQHPGEQIDQGDRGEQGVDEGEHARDHHQDSLQQVPKRITLDRLAHSLAQGGGGCIDGNGHGWSP